ncbi:MAG TPA: MBL fold metallo-hydrolase [Candidatus Tectomicrobia bacterium]
MQTANSSNLSLCVKPVPMSNTGMRVCIHRGAHEIGGSCVEVEAAGQRIVLDVGLPLGAEADVALLPKVRGFREPDASLLGVVISHPHQDHYGLAQYLRPEIPVLIGEAAARILQAARPFARSGVAFEHIIPLQDRKTITLGPFEITPYLVDHSAYDSYALLVEADGRRLFYTGDLRGHGRKAALFEKLIRQPPRAVDVLLMEGTTIGRHATRPPLTEDALVARFSEQFKGTSDLCLVWASGQNIDRLVSIFKACRKAGRQLIVDLYTAEILRATGNPRLPQAMWNGMRVYVTQQQRIMVKRNAMFEVVDRNQPKRIFPRELAEAAGNSVMLFRPSMAAELERAGCLKGARLIYSLWEGYLKQERLKPFHNRMRKHQIPMTIIHTSGHASVADLQRLAKAIQQRSLVPIHSANPSGFRGRFQNVMLQKDGVWWEV